MQPSPARTKRFSPIQSVLIGFALLGLVGALLLKLPLATQSGVSQPFIDAFFVAMSAVSTTGLSVVDPGSYYSFFGQVVLMILFQVGGLGYMTFFAFLVYLFRSNLSIDSSEALQASLATPSQGEALRYVKQVLWFTFVFELLGAIILGFVWLGDMPAGQAFFWGLFHSISAFCTAGFALLPDSFTGYQDHLTVNLTINLLSISGGIGFLVLNDFQSYMTKLRQHRFPRHLTIHSKLAIVVFASMTVALFAIVLTTEYVDHPRTLGQNILIAGFQAISTTTTTGFNSVNVGTLSRVTLLAMIFMMFIGAPAGGTGGGIKSTTFGVILLFIWSLLTGSREINVFNRRLANSTLHQALGTAIIAAFWTMIVVGVLAATEKASLLNILFETTSAMGTVGLTTGLSAGLSFWGRIMITITMWIGRVGPLTIGLSLLQKSGPPAYHFPEENVFVG